MERQRKAVGLAHLVEDLAPIASGQRGSIYTCRRKEVALMQTLSASFELKRKTIHVSRAGKRLPTNVVPFMSRYGLLFSFVTSGKCIAGVVLELKDSS